MQSPSMGAQYVAMQNILYHKAIGMIMYTMLGTHPDISYTVLFPNSQATQGWLIERPWKGFIDTS